MEIKEWMGTANQKVENYNPKMRYWVNNGVIYWTDTSNSKYAKHLKNKLKIKQERNAEKKKKVEQRIKDIEKRKALLILEKKNRIQKIIDSKKVQLKQLEDSIK